MPTPTDRFPRDVTTDGVTVGLSLMTAGDRDEMVAFAKALPPHDLLFLRRDITRIDAVDAWIREIDDGEIYTVLAHEGERLVGYSTLHLSRQAWSRHVAEIRVVVAEGMRGKGLGGLLTQEVFTLALEVEKIVARMTLDLRDRETVARSKASSYSDHRYRTPRV